MLRSPKLVKLRHEYEIYVSQGREVKLAVHPEEGKTRYEIELNWLALKRKYYREDKNEICSSTNRW